MKPADTTRGTRYSFDVHLANGQRKPGLRNSFLKVMDITRFPVIVLQDRTEWVLYTEDEVDDMLEGRTYIKCIVSFQVFDDGECIAVARKYREKVGA